MELKVCACHEVKRFLLLDGYQGDSQQIWATYDVSLELNIIRFLILHAIVNVLARHTDLLLSFRVHDVPGAHIRVIRLSNAAWHSDWPDKVNIIKFFASMNHSWNHLLFHATL